MIRLLVPIPIHCAIAVSGGLDSTFAVDFVANGGRRPLLAWFDHKTEASFTAQAVVASLSSKTGLDLKVGTLTRKRPKGVSLEAFWRDERYNFLKSLTMPVVTGHHLDDAVETWMFGAMHGRPTLIPRKNDPTIRPFLATSRAQIEDWAIRRNLKWVNDPSNYDRRHPRNRIRHEIVPQALLVNPGLRTVIRKKYESGQDVR